EEMLAWRKAGAWDRMILGVGGITSVDRALHLLHEGSDAALVATAALVDPLFAVRYRTATAAVSPAPLPTNGARAPSRGRSTASRDARRAPRRAKRPISSKRRKHAVR